MVEQGQPESLNASSKAIARNAITGYLTLAASSLLGILVTPFLLDRLGPAAFGLYAVVLAGVGIVGAVESGLGTTTVTRVAALERQGNAVVSGVLSTSRAAYVPLTLLAGVIFAVLALFADSLFRAPDSLADSTWQVLLLLGTWQIVALFTAVFSAALIGTGRQYLLVRSGFVIGTGTTLAQVTAVALGGGIRSMATLLVLGGLLGLVVQQRLVARHLPGVVIEARAAARADLRLLLGQSWRNGLAQTASGLAYASDVLIVGIFLGPVAAAAYAVAQRVIVLLRTLSTKMVDVLTPVYAHVGQRDSREGRAAAVFADAVSAMGLIAIPLGVSAASFAEPLLALWLGRVPDGSNHVLVILGVVLCLQVIGHNAFVMLQGLQQTGLLLRFVLIAAAVNITVSVALTLQLGVTGPALGSLTAVLVVDCVALPVLLARVLRLPLRSFLRRTCSPMLPGTVAAVLTATVLSLTVDPRGALTLVACSCVAVSYCAAWWWLGGASPRLRAGIKQGLLHRT